MNAHARMSIYVLTATAMLFAGVALADEFEMIRWTVDGGGAMRAGGGDFELSGTAGQSDPGALMSGGEFELTGGFWFRQAEGDCNCDSAVNLFDFDAFTDCMSGPGGGLPAPECVCFDFDGDADVDLIDFGLFQTAVTG